MSSLFDPHEQWLDLLHISARQTLEILENLDVQAGAGLDGGRRGDDRFPFRMAGGLMVEINHPGGSRLSCLVRTRNISRHGSSFLHGGFLHAGSRCTMLLKSRVAGTSDRDGAVTIEGVVRHCRLVAGRVHEVGVRFDHPIDLGSFMLEDTAADHDGDAAGPERLTGSILIMDSREDERELLRFQLIEAGAAVEAAADAPAAKEMLEEGGTDMIIVGLGDIKAKRLADIRHIRQYGFVGPILVWGQDISAQARRILQGFGADLSIGRQQGFACLRDAVCKFFYQAGTMKQPPLVPLPSKLWENLKVRPLILRYMETLEDQCCKITELRRTLAWDALRKLCAEIAGSSNSFGFPDIQDSARALAQAVLNPDDAQRIDDCIQAHALLCQRALLVKANTPIAA